MYMSYEVQGLTFSLVNNSHLRSCSTSHKRNFSLWGLPREQQEKYQNVLRSSRRDLKLSRVFVIALTAVLATYETISPTWRTSCEVQFYWRLILGGSAVDKFRSLRS